MSRSKKNEGMGEGKTPNLPSLPTVATPSHARVSSERTEQVEIVLDVFSSGYSEEEASYSNLQKTLNPSPSEQARVPEQAQSVEQRTFDGSRQLLSKASSQIADESGLNYMGPEGVVEHPFNMDALVMLNDMSVVRKACINALATNTARLGYRIRKTSPDVGEQDSDEVAEQIIDWLEKCAEQDDSSFVDLLYKVKFDEESCGNGYIEVTRDMEGYIAGFHYIPGRTIWIRRDRSGFVQRIAGKEQSFYNFGDVWRIGADGKPELMENRDPEIHELIHFKLHSSNSNFYGVPRDVAAITTMYGDELARNHNTKFFTHSATPDLLLVFEVDKQAAGRLPGQQPKVSIPQNTKRDIENHFRKNLTTSSYKPGIFHMPPGVKLKIERLSSEQKDAGWINYRKENRAEVQIAFQTPGVIIANTGDGSNYATVMQEKSLYLESMVKPEQVRYQTRLMAKLWPELVKVKAPETPDEVDESGDVTRPASVDIRPKEGTGVNRHIWKLEFVSMSIADQATLAQIHNIYGTLGVITKNEIRQDIGRKSMEGGDTAPKPAGGAEGNAAAQNADARQVAAGNPDMDSFVSTSFQRADLTGMGSGRGPNGVEALPGPRRPGDSSVPRNAAFGTVGQPIRKDAPVDDMVVLSRDAYELLHEEVRKAREVDMDPDTGTEPSE